MSGYLAQRQLAYEAGRVGKQPDLGTMFGLYGRGVQATGDTPQRRRRVDEEQAKQWAHDDEVSQEHFRQQQALTQQRHPNSIPTTPEELAAYLDRKRQVAAITGKTFDQQKELLALKQRFNQELIGDRGDQQVRVEGVRQEGRSALEDQRQGGRVELQGNKIEADSEKQKADLAYKADALQNTLADKNLSREERAAYNKQLIDLRKQAQALNENKFDFFKWLKPKEEEGRNTRAANAQAGATARVEMQQTGANERNAANNSVRQSEGELNRSDSMTKHYDWLRQRQAQLEASISSKDLDREVKIQLAQELLGVRKSIAEMNDATKRQINDTNEGGRNSRAAAAQEGATTRTGMNNDAAMQRTNAQQAGANQRNEANNTVRVGEGEANRGAALDRQTRALQQRNDALNAQFADRNLTREQRAALQQEAESIRLQINDANNKVRTSEGDKNRLTGVYKQSVQNEFQGGQNDKNRLTRVYIDSADRASREGENSKNREAAAQRQQSAQQESRFQSFYRQWFGAGENQKKRDFQAEQGNLNRTARSDENDKRIAAAAARSAAALNTRITMAASRSNDPNARFIVDHAQKAGEIELMQAHARNAPPQEIDAITEKYAQEVERALNKR